VTEFVAQHGNNLLRLALLKQGIVDDNVLLPRQTIEVSVAMGTALAAINDVQLRERKLQFFSQVLDTSLNITRLQRRELVEQRQNHNRINGNRKDLDEDAEHPQVVEERVASLLNDLEHSADNGSSKHNSEYLTLEHVRHPELECLLVETELLFEHKSLIVRDREREDSAEYVETEDEHERLGDFTLESTGKIARQQESADAPKLGEDIAVDKHEILDLTVETGHETEVGLCATIGL